MSRYVVTVSVLLAAAMVLGPVRSASGDDHECFVKHQVVWDLPHAAQVVSELIAPGYYRSSVKEEDEEEVGFVDLPRFDPECGELQSAKVAVLGTAVSAFSWSIWLNGSGGHDYGLDLGSGGGGALLIMSPEINNFTTGGGFDGVSGYLSGGCGEEHTTAMADLLRLGSRNDPIEGDPLYCGPYMPAHGEGNNADGSANIDPELVKIDGENDTIQFIITGRVGGGGAGAPASGVISGVWAGNLSIEYTWIKGENCDCECNCE